MTQIVITPERDLIAAVLHRAIMDANSDGAAYNSGYRDEAIEFLHLNNEPELIEIVLPEAMSFIWICHWLDLDWRSLRKAIRSQLFIEPCIEFPSEVIELHEPTERDNGCSSRQTIETDSESY